MSFSYSSSFQPANTGLFPTNQLATTNTSWPMGADAHSAVPGIQAANPQSIDNFAVNNQLFPTQEPSKSQDPKKPDLMLHHFSELTPETVHSKGNIRGMIFDVDDTLSRFQLKNRTIPPELKTRLKALQDSGIKLGVVSNNPSSKSVLKLQSELAKSGINVAVENNAKKPGTQGLNKMLQNFNQDPNQETKIDPSQVMMVGDNPLTDVAGGKKAGFKTAQVDWFGNSQAHKAAMVGGDLALSASQKLESIVLPGLDKAPEVYPPKMDLQPQAIAVAS